MAIYLPGFGLPATDEQSHDRLKLTFKASTVVVL